MSANFSAALSAARATVRCPACGVDWTEAAAAVTTAVRRLPACGHAVCLGCYARLYRAAASATSAGVACPACGSACRLRPEQLPPDAGIVGLVRLLRLRLRHRPVQADAQTPTVRPPLELTAASYAPAYLARRRALLCLQRDRNNQQVQAVDSDTGRHLASLQLAGLNGEGVTITGLCIVCPIGVAEGVAARPHLLLADRYRDRLHIADLTGRCLQTVASGVTRPGQLWADWELALVVTRDGAELLVLAWEEGGRRLGRLGAVSAISGRQLAGLRCVVGVGGCDSNDGGVEGCPRQILLLHSGGISGLDRSQLMRRLRRVAASGGGTDATGCDATADWTLTPGDFGLDDCTTMASGGCGGGGGDECGGCLLFLAGREASLEGPARPPLEDPAHGLRVLRPAATAGGGVGSVGWRLAASVGCRCRCERCFRGCAGCVHQSRLPADGLAFDEAERRLFVCRRGSRLVQVVHLPAEL